MPRKSVKKEKTSKRGKGDVKQSVKVSVRIGETKPKRKRVYKRKPKGEGDLARVGETRTLYSNLPPQTITIAQQQPLPLAFQQQPSFPSITSGDVEKAKLNLLEGIEKQTQEIVTKAISKAQGAEQRGELARIGWIEPIAKMPTISENIETTAPSFTEIKDNSKPKLIIVNESEQETEAESEIQRTISEQEKRNIKAKERRTDIGRDKIYSEILSQYGFPAIKGNMNQEEFSKKIISIFEAVNSGGKKRVSKSNIQDYYGQKFNTLLKLAKSKSKIPVKNIEELPLTQQTTQEYNLTRF